MEDGYRRSEEMLKPTPLPDSVTALKKLGALADSGSSHLVGFCSQVITESGCLVDTGSDCFRRPVRVAA